MDGQAAVLVGAQHAFGVGLDEGCDYLGWGVEFAGFVDWEDGPQRFAGPVVVIWVFVWNNIQKFKKMRLN